MKLKKLKKVLVSVLLGSMLLGTFSVNPVFASESVNSVNAGQETLSLQNTENPAQQEDEKKPEENTLTEVQNEEENAEEQDSSFQAEDSSQPSAGEEIKNGTAALEESSLSQEESYASEEDSEAPVNQEKEEENSSGSMQEKKAQESAAETSSTPSNDQGITPYIVDESTGKADMRISVLSHSGFIMSAGQFSGNYAPIFHSSEWSGSNLGGVLPNGHYVYCIEPEVTLASDTSYREAGSLGDKNYLMNLTTSRITTRGVIFAMMGRVLKVCGPDITMASDIINNPAQATKYLAAQVIIWQITEGDMDANFVCHGSNWKTVYDISSVPYWNSAPSGGRSIKSWYDEWITKLQNSKKIPSFMSRGSASAPEYDMDSTTITLTDTNNVLQYVELTASNSSVKLSVDGNKLTISNPNRVDFSLTATNTICDGAREPVPIMTTNLDSGTSRQKTVTASTTHLSDPIQGFLNVEAEVRRTEILKVDKTTGAALSGAELQLIDSTGKVIDTWTSSSSAKVFENLPLGNYKVREVSAPGGYVTAADVSFTVTDTSEPIKVTMEDDITRTEILKVDSSTGKPLAGAHLQIINSQGDIVADWTSTETAYAINKLPVGKYTLHEVGAPAGYVTAADIPFEVKNSAEPIKVTMYDDITKVEILKIDAATGQPLVGAKLQLINANGDIVDEWISADQAHTLEKLPIGIYTLREVSAPSGYATAADVSFEVKNSAETVKVTMSDEQTVTKILKIDDSTGKPLVGAKLQLLDAEGNLIDEWISSEEAYILYGLPYGTYTLKEVETPEGYVTADDVTFEVVDSAKPLEIRMNDKITEIKIGKIDQITGEYLAGAKLRLLNAETQEQVAEWITTSVPTVFQKLPIGKYILEEVVTPAGYVTAKAIEFEVPDAAGTIEITMEDDITRTEILKIDKSTGKPLVGAKLQLLDAEGNLIDEWISSEEPYILYKLPWGIYTLKEVETPAGYVTAEDMIFEVVDSGKPIEIVMEDDITTTEIIKIDQSTNKPLVGAELQLFDAEGNLVDQWTSGEEPYILYKLPLGTYTLHEAKTPSGYATADDITFEVVDSAKPVEITMYDAVTKVEISKKDITNQEELPGAKLQIIDEKGNIVEEWISEETPHYIEKLPVGQYILHEEIAPDGYVTAADISFEVLDSGEIQKVEMIDDVTKVEISKKDITNQEELPGATLQIIDEKGNVLHEWVSTEEPHYIEKLPVGKYTLHEVLPPAGHITASDVAFEILDTGEIHQVEMIDDVTKVELQKIDATTGKPVSGAKLQVIDSNGKIWYEWTTGDNSITIKKLPIGKYTLHEVSAPDRYILAEDVSFEVKDEEDVQVVVMENQLEGRVTIDNNGGGVQTGDDNQVLLYIGIGATCLLILLIIVYLKRRQQDNE